MTLTSDALPDEIMAVAASYDDTLKHGAQTPFSDQLTFKWEGGMWEYDAYHSSIITTGNGGTKPTQAAFTIFYNQGTQRYDLEQTLQPDEQMWIDVGKLIREHVPDKNGNALPPGLTSGSYEFRDLTNTGVGTLFEGKIIYDKTYGHVVYGCGTCCGYAQAKVFFDPLGVFLNDTGGDGVNGYENCYLTWDDVSDSFYNKWTSLNKTIATVDYYGSHTGVSPGSTTSNTLNYLDGVKHAPSCPQQLFNPSGGVNAFTQTPSQHTYPNPPLSGCRVSVPFDGIVNTTTGKKHQAQDTVGTNIQVGTPVYAPESGNITAFVQGKPHDPRPVSQCAGQNSPANYIQITGSDQGVTRLYHVTILPALAQQPTPIPITGGQQIGTIDISGCTSGPHTHIQRKFNGVLVNFTTPCDNSHFDDPSTYYDDSDGTWP